MKVYVSGVHSGPNPSPGVGLARSLRAAYPDAHLVAVDYSIRSSGIHHEAFDEVRLYRAWNELNLQTHAYRVERLLKRGAFWLSGLDLEVEFLAEQLPCGDRILVPPRESLFQIAKPEIRAARGLPVCIPDTISALEPDWELHRFCRRHGWRVWLKGPNYEARFTHDWHTFLRARSELEDTWSTKRLFLQADVAGCEEAIVFSACRGRLVGCVRMTKRSQTLEGKTWAGHVCEVDTEMRARLESVVSELMWTGGGELEFIRDSQQRLHLIDWNPRFPAWVHGATLAGQNLPARLLEAAGAPKGIEFPSAGPQFTRVVLEVPVRPKYLLPSAPQGAGAPKESAKHPSGMPQLARKKGRAGVPSSDPQPPAVPDSIIADLCGFDLKDLQTPTKVILKETARRTLDRVKAFSGPVENTGVHLQFAYSVKTNPHPYIMAVACRSGMLAEAISEGEFRHALACGFSPDRVVANGPANGCVGRHIELHAVFADSLDAFAGLATCATPSNGIIGLRLRPPGFDSRFGVNVADYERFCELVSTVSRLGAAHRFGIHFHTASDVIGTNRWWKVLDSVLEWARAIESLTNRPVRCLDVGGGWFPDDFEAGFLPNIREAVGRAKYLLPGLEEVVVEPGKAIAQPTMALLTRVVEVRRDGTTAPDVVVDGAVSDLPMASSFPHRVLMRQSDGHWIPLRSGESRILGAVCMEADILANGIAVPSEIRTDDVVAFCDAGAYDASMAYDFGNGEMLNAGEVS